MRDVELEADHWQLLAWRGEVRLCRLLLEGPPARTPERAAYFERTRERLARAEATLADLERRRRG